MSKLPCPQQHVAQVPESERDKCKPYTTLPAPCQVRTCGLQATEEHHVVRRSFTRSWAVRDYALLYREVVPVKLPLCSAHHRDCTENRAYFEFTPGPGFVFWHERTGLTEGTKDDVPSAIEALSPAEPGLVSASVAEPLPSLSVSPGHNESGLTEGEQARQAVDPDRDASEQADSVPRVSDSALTAAGQFTSPRSPSVNPGQSCPTCQRRIPYPKVETSPTSAVWSMRMPSDAKEDFRGIVDALAAHLGAGEERYGSFKALLTAAVYALQVAPERVLSEIGERVS